MKNDLTAEEWLVLSEYLRFSGFAFYDWEDGGMLKEKYELLESAEKKFYKVAEEIKRG